MQQVVEQQTTDTKLLLRREKDRLRKQTFRARQKEQLQVAQESTKGRWRRLSGHLQSELPDLYAELLAEHKLLEGLEIETWMIRDMLADRTLYPDIKSDEFREMVEMNFKELVEIASKRGVWRGSWQQLEDDVPPTKLSIRELLHAAPGKRYSDHDERFRDVDNEPLYSRASQAYRLFGFRTQPEEYLLVASANALLRYAVDHEVDATLLEQAKRSAFDQYRHIRQSFGSFQ